MTREDADRWDARYDGQPLAVSTRPDALTDDIVALLPGAGRALDVACGAGGQTIWLAQQGLDVTAIDVSPKAVELTRAACDAAHVGADVGVQVVDLDDGLAPSLGSFDVIVCQRFRATHLYDAFVNRLQPGGVAIVTVLSQTGAASPGPFHAPSGELVAAFGRDECEILHHVEGDGQESIVIRRVRA